MLAGLCLVDRQIVDAHGRLAGKVDDLELEVDDADPEEPPTVVAVLSGPGALASRLGGRLGRWLESVHRRLHPAGLADAAPARLDFRHVSEVGDHVSTSLPREVLETHRGEAWAREHVVEHIPGAGRAPE
jgi:hypothetical protein